MSRQRIVDAALNAYTLDECLTVERSLVAWFGAHPEDTGLHEIAVMLGIVKSAAQEREATTLSRQKELAPVGS